MERRDFYPSCEAPIHNDRCDGIGNTQDHFTPRAVAKLLGWSRKQIDDPQNKQALSIPCHRDKDQDTPLRVQLLRMEKKGTIFTFEQHRTIFEAGEIVVERNIA